jgi:hypothetical protein
MFQQESTGFTLHDSHTLHASFCSRLRAIPLQASSRPLEIQEVEASRISRKSAHEGDKIVGCTHRQPLSAININNTHLC